jgi:predicted dehydrogenase
VIDAAIVGLGRWGQRIVTSVQGTSERIRFVRGMVRNPDAAREFAFKNAFELSARFEDVLSDKRVQVVVLATPHSVHLEQILAAAQAGKHVLCEKPLTLTTREAERAVKACKDGGVLLGVGHDKRYLAPMQALRRIVASGSLGKILHAEANTSNDVGRPHYKPWRGDEKEAPGASLTSTGIHMIDALVSMLGPAGTVYAQLVEHDVAPNFLDSVTLVLELRQRISATVCTARPSPYFWRAHIFGSTGSAEAIGETELVLRMSGEKPKRMTFERVDSVRLSVEAFADGVSGRSPYPMTTEEIVGTIAAFEAAVASMKSKQPVTLSN